MARKGICICEKHGRALMRAKSRRAKSRRVVFHKEELLFRWSDAETGISGIERDKELLLREVFVNC
jgi:hypothetical protein